MSEHEMSEAARLQHQAYLMGVALDLWATRDDTRPQPEVREAGGTAVGVIDAMLAELHAMRSRLVAEIRQYDDASGARADALLARIRAAAQVTEAE